MRLALFLLTLFAALPTLADDGWFERQDRFETDRRLQQLEEREADAARQRQADADLQAWRDQAARERLQQRLDNLERCAQGSVLCNRPALP